MKRTIMRADSRRGFLKFLAIGCGVIVLVGVIGVFMLVKNVHKIAAAGVEAGFTAMVEGSPMPDAQKKDMLAQIKSLADDVRSKKIGMEEFAKIMQEFAEGPLLSLGLISAAQLQFFEGATLSEEETKDAQLAFERFARGVVEGKIKQDQIKPVTEMVIVQKPNGQSELKKLSDAERAELLAKIKEVVDAAAIPNEPYQVDYAGEFKKLIDRAMGREVLDDSASFEGETEPVESLDRPESVEQESLDLDQEKEFPAEAPAN